ncbi:GntR family transcriptional regulator [Enterococcus faecium]|uniref:GntR family transcriptional regulator n=1 Tax=Enterococcus faecium TaxID=1352 RepID=UPI0025B08121|nr:GntR family transcriptional regulator [Enterococcus faecium]EME8213762.1 GntR family transcriptional regulator [Enterococcus faecium]MDN3079773.1 GntR family transcriptional regulator [Enterococcus faecium]MDQ8230796.1 GntR family transcriptional regulator [Enterococcus faecium]MDQ8233360.1 GntR family transcriptional regulator [Enterococcus faecium]MDQ8240697.1 GntR family transcriptional regulator [Enterococcus faecium]
MTTKYEIIKRNIINQIENVEFLPGEKIYSEGDLRKIYKVSSITLIKALNDLVNEGYLIRRQGEGTYVRKNIKHRRVLFSEQMLMNDLSNVKKLGKKL